MQHVCPPVSEALSMNSASTYWSLRVGVAPNWVMIILNQLEWFYLPNHNDWFRNEHVTQFQQVRCDRRCFLRASKGFPHFSESYGESGLVFLPDVSKRACSPYCSWWPSGVRNVGWGWHWMAEWRNGKKLRARLYYWAPESISLKTIYFNTFSYANYKCPGYLNRLE